MAHLTSLPGVQTSGFRWDVLGVILLTKSREEAIGMVFEIIVFLFYVVTFLNYTFNHLHLKLEAAKLNPKQ